MSTFSPVELDTFKNVAKKATPGPWLVISNYPFYAIVEKPTSSLSKEDDRMPTYWRVEDGYFHATFNPTTVLALLSYIDHLNNQIKDQDVLKHQLDVATKKIEHAKTVLQKLNGQLTSFFSDLFRLM